VPCLLIAFLRLSCNSEKIDLNFNTILINLIVEYKFERNPIMIRKLMSIIIFLNCSFLFSAIVLDIGTISQGDGIYADGEMFDDANSNGMWDEGETVYDDTLDITFNSDVNIRGFQFDLSGMNLMGGTGGAAETNDFDIYASGDTVLGFSLNGQIIPSGTGTLTTLYGSISEEVCLPFVQGMGPEQDTPIFADEDGNAYSDITIEEDSECEMMSNHENLTFNLFETFPNPFNPELNINLNIEQSDYIQISVYNVNGQLVQTIYNGFISGNQLYNFTWDASDFSSGIYIINIDSEHLTQSKIVNLLK